MRRQPRSPAPEATRRITRSLGLARFAYNPNSAVEDVEVDIGSAASPDIEDAVPDQMATARKRKRKRERVGVRKVVVKKEEEEMEDGEGEREEEEGGTRTGPMPSKRKLAARRNPIPGTQTEPESASTPKRKTKTITKTITSSIQAPENWEEVYALVKSMRYDPEGIARNAPVDTMGCERLALPGASDKDRRFQTLIALMLSSQTKDTVNAVAMRRLQTELPAATTHSNPTSSPGLNLENILACPADKLNNLIQAVGFHNTKTKHIKQTALILRDIYAGDIPSSFDDLVSLPGVGPKMAHLCLSAAWGRTEGIGVDVHVHRITNLWGWNGGITKTPEETRQRLEAWLPRDRWRDINALLVGFGQTVCTPLPAGRRCGDCALGLRGLCRAADAKKVAEGRKRKGMSVSVRDGVGKIVDDGGVVEVEGKGKGKVKEVERGEGDDERDVHVHVHVHVMDPVKKEEEAS
ncbi:putative DNA repair protein NTG1 [Xylariaceae sp. FL0594]|nr:putative DNA repair protein NTG1 [Xylariaceae sp. FL0594]